MIDGKKIAVVLPAYNAGDTIEKTVSEIHPDWVDWIILCDDDSKDNTIKEARNLPIDIIIEHHQNRGYGGNQKSLYNEALAVGADIIVLLHPDYQYTPKLLPAMVSMLNSGIYDVVIASRILGKGALQGGMPLYKYVANRFLTFFQNVVMNQKLSEYHTGYRAFTKEALNGIDFNANSDDFIFDNQMLAQLFFNGFTIAELSCPTKYFAEASSINFSRSMKYGLGVLGVSLQYRLAKWGIMPSRYLQKKNKS